MASHYNIKLKLIINPHHRKKVLLIYPFDPMYKHYPMSVQQYYTIIYRT